MAVPANAPQTPEQQLETAESRLHDLQTRLTASHPDIVRARLTVERLRRQVEDRRAARSAAGAFSASAERLTPTEIARRNRVTALTTELQGLLRIIEQKQTDETRLRSNVEVVYGEIK